MAGRHKPDDFTHQPRRDSIYQERVHDPYQSREKYREPTVCPDCTAVFHNGRWQWGPVPDGAHRHRCPACARIHDRVPAGILTIEGDYFAAHKAEILSLVHHHEAQENVEHPLERIIAIDEQGQGATISFTGVHLARGTGEALRHACHGELTIDFSDKDDLIRVSWKR